MITPDQILALRPCPDWTHKRIADLIGDGVTPDQLAEILIESVGPTNARWLCSHILDHAHRVTWAADCAERVLHIFEEQYPNDKRPRNAIEAARQDTTTTTTAYAIHDAAYVAAVAADAAYVAAHAAAAAARAAAAAAAAAYAAYTTSAYIAATYAADAAAAAVTSATNAADAAAAYASYADEHAWQIRHACELLNGCTTQSEETQ